MLSLQISIDEHLSDDQSLQERVAMLECLNEVRSQAYLNLAAIQKWRKTYYNNTMKSKTLIDDHLVLLYDTHLKIKIKKNLM